MFIHPDLIWAQAKQHQCELIAEADAHRLLVAARRSRRARGRSDANGAGGGGPDHELRVPAAASRAGNLAGCGPHVAAPAR